MATGIAFIDETMARQRVRTTRNLFHQISQTEEAQRVRTADLAPAITHAIYLTLTVQNARITSDN